MLIALVQWRHNMMAGSAALDTAQREQQAVWKKLIRKLEELIA